MVYNGQRPDFATWDIHAQIEQFIEFIRDPNLNIDDLLCPVCDNFIGSDGCPDHPAEPLQRGLFDQAI